MNKNNIKQLETDKWEPKISDIKSHAASDSKYKLQAYFSMICSRPEEPDFILVIT